MEETVSTVKTLIIVALAVSLAYLLGTTRALGDDPPALKGPPVLKGAVVAPAPRPATPKVAPLGTPPGPNFQWRHLPGIGWGWVQDGVTLPPAAATAPKLQSVVGPAPGPACDT